MKTKSTIALLAVSLLLTACSEISETNEIEQADVIISETSVETSSAKNTATAEKDTSTETKSIMKYEYWEVEPQCKPSSGVSFELPYDWSYETVQTDDEPTSSVSVYIKPNAESDGCITIEYTRDGLAFCGTGLERKDIDFNGHSAWKGTYDGSENWDFILLNDDDYEGCAVLNQAYDWYNKYADEIEYILSTIEFRKYE